MGRQNASITAVWNSKKELPSGACLLILHYYGLMYRVCHNNCYCSGCPSIIKDGKYCIVVLTQYSQSVVECDDNHISIGRKDRAIVWIARIPLVRFAMNKNYHRQALTADLSRLVILDGRCCKKRRWKKVFWEISPCAMLHCYFLFTALYWLYSGLRLTEQEKDELWNAFSPLAADFFCYPHRTFVYG